VLQASNQIQCLSDTGLLCYLLGLDDRALPQSPYLGAVWESAVYAQLRKRRDKAGDRTTLWFYRDAQQREVDFVVAVGNERHLMEAKWTENPSTRDSQTLQSVAQMMKVRGRLRRYAVRSSVARRICRCYRTERRWSIWRNCSDEKEDTLFEAALTRSNTTDAPLVLPFTSG